MARSISTKISQSSTNDHVFDHIEDIVSSIEKCVHNSLLLFPHFSMSFDDIQSKNAPLDILREQNRNLQADFEKLTLENDRYRKKIQKLQNQLTLEALCNNKSQDAQDSKNRSNISDSNDPETFASIVELQNKLIEVLKEKYTLVVQNSILQQTCANLSSMNSKRHKYFDIFVSQFKKTSLLLSSQHLRSPPVSLRPGHGHRRYPATLDAGFWYSYCRQCLFPSVLINGATYSYRERDNLNGPAKWKGPL